MAGLYFASSSMVLVIWGHDTHIQDGLVCINATSVTKSHLSCQRCRPGLHQPFTFPKASDALYIRTCWRNERQWHFKIMCTLNYSNPYSTTMQVHNHRTLCSLTHTCIDIICVSSHSAQNYDTYLFQVILLILARGEKRARVWKSIEKMVLHHCI